MKLFVVVLIFVLSGADAQADVGEACYILDHWEVDVHEVWHWGEGGYELLQQWDSISAEVTTFSWSGESDDGTRSASGTIWVSVPHVIDIIGGFYYTDVAISGMASVKVRSSWPTYDTAFFRVGTKCHEGSFNGYGPCSYESQAGAGNAGDGPYFLTAHQTGEYGGYPQTLIMTFNATAGAHGLLGGSRKNIQEWTIRAKAFYRSATKPGSDNSVEAGNVGITEQLTGYINPVIIAGPPTYRDRDPGVVRIKNVQPDSFHIRFQEWEYLDGEHADEIVDYLVFEAGHATQEDGGELEVGTFQLSGTGQWDLFSFQKEFPGRPHIFLTIQTNNGSEAVMVRARNVNTVGFEAALFEEEALMDGHQYETVGYLAIYSSEGWGELDVNEMKIPYILQRVNIDHRFTPVLTSDLKLEEERSRDIETAHVDEAVDVLVLKDLFFAQIIGLNSQETVALRRFAPEYDGRMEWGLVHGIDQAWTQVPLTKSYGNPIVVAKPVSGFDAEPGVIRLRDISRDSFELRYQEWDYLDGAHAKENIFYLVSDMGTHTIAGLDVEAWKYASSTLVGPEEWDRVGMDTGFSQMPALFTGVQTSNGPEAVTCRIRNASPSAFDLAMSRQENHPGVHVQETLGWIAISQGFDTASDGRSVIAQVFDDSFQGLSLSFVPFEHRYPNIVCDVMSTVESDPVFIRYLGITDSKALLYLQEEKSADQELNHANETVSVFLSGYTTSDQMPVADAGIDQKVSSGEIVTLDGSDSIDPDGEIASYQWVQMSGPGVIVNNADSSKASFRAPYKRSTLLFELTVTDNSGNSSLDLVSVVCQPRCIAWIRLLLDE